MIKPKISFILVTMMLPWVFICSSPIVSGDYALIVKIISVEHPAQVYSGQTFSVNVTVQYSYLDWTIADLGIFAPNFTSIVASLRYYLSGSESKTFSFTIEAPIEKMEWKLNAITRYWYKDNWCYDENNCVFPFSIEVIGNCSSNKSGTQLTTVSIANSKWHYWHKTGSDSCLLWLGGGRSESSYVTINPYEFESFGTMSYINDLAKNYSILALYEGPYTRGIPCGDEVAHILKYSRDSKFIHEVHSWIVENGYEYAYLIGYSTGGVAVGYEISKRDPKTWEAPNGAIIISAPLKSSTPEGALSSTFYADEVKANVLLMYGVVWSEELWPQGKEFYEKLPNEGWSGVSWYHKEWYLFPDSGHEVWLKEGYGEFYDSIPSYSTINFIQKCKSLSKTNLNGNAIKNGSSILMEIKMRGEPDNPYLLLHAYTSKNGIDCSRLSREGQDLLGNLSKYFDGSVQEEGALSVKSQIADILNDSLRLMYGDEKVVYMKTQNQPSDNFKFFKFFYNTTSKSLHWELNAEVHGTFLKSSDEGYSTDLRVRYFKAYAHPLTFYRINDDGSIDFKTKFRVNMANVLALEFSWLSVPIQDWNAQHLGDYGTIFSIETPEISFYNGFGELCVSYKGEIDAIGNAAGIQDTLSSPLPVPELRHVYLVLFITLTTLVLALVRKKSSE
ncbi:MAG: hypothetical protein QW201_01085 [Thermoproteota archaeon]